MNGTPEPQHPLGRTVVVNVEFTSRSASATATSWHVEVVKRGPERLLPTATSRQRVLHAALRVVPVAWIAGNVIRAFARRLPSEHRPFFLTTYASENAELAADKVAQLRHLVGLRGYLKSIREMYGDDPTDEE